SRSSCRDDAGVDARPIEPAENACVFDLDAVIHDHLEARVDRDLRGFEITDTELHPENAGVNRDRFTRDGDHLLRLAKTIDDIDRIGDRTQVRIAFFAEDLAVVRIYR